MNERQNDYMENESLDDINLRGVIDIPSREDDIRDMIKGLEDKTRGDEYSPKKVLEFFYSDGKEEFAIFTFEVKWYVEGKEKVEKRIIFEVYDLKEKESVFSYIREKSLINTHVMNIVNRKCSMKK